MLSIETRGLCHRYRKSDPGIERLDLEVPEGSIYGFLGPNGAGKSTVLRLLIGLLKKQRGSVSIFGKSFDTHRIAILRRIGSLIETPSLYDHLTAHENLALPARIYGVPGAWIDDALGLVGLAGTKRKLVAQFSLGMKQRLGIAMALLHRPELLVLDEPTNGLDPNGTVEMRGLIQRLHRERGITILVSSHVLAEMEKLVTDVGILVDGRLRFQGTLQALRAQFGVGGTVALRTADDARAFDVLGATLPACIRDARGIVLPAMGDGDIAAINRHLVEHGVAVFSIAREEHDLEAIFMDLVA